MSHRYSLVGCVCVCVCVWCVCVCVCVCMRACVRALLHLNSIYSPVTMVIDTGMRALAGHCH